MMTETEKTERRTCDGFDWCFMGPAGLTDPGGPSPIKCAETAVRECDGRWLCEEHFVVIRTSPLYLAHLTLTYAAEVLDEESDFSEHYNDERSERLFEEAGATALARSRIESAMERAERFRLAEARAADSGSHGYRREIADGRWTVKWPRPDGVS